MTHCVTRLFIVILLLALYADGKTRGNRHEPGSSGEVSRRSSAAEIEARFRPHLEQRVNDRRGERPRRPARDEFLVLMRAWDELSGDFQALYKEATAIPADYEYFISPGGKFRIFYTTTGINSVDTANTFHYGEGDRWNIRYYTPNYTPDGKGIPDYISEAAFALDSSWSMMVDRFGFSEPLAAPGPDGSTKYYNVLITYMDDGFYGETIFQGRNPGTDRGFLSYIEVNSDWSDWSDYGYDERPLDALRVTCVHEIFHAVQYSMVWNVRQNVFLDDFPLGWTEGSAVLMEDIAFPEVKDYLQYVGGYFSNPRRTMLLLNDVISIYLNSILFKYLYERTNPDSGDIAFIKKMYDNNSAARDKPFHENLELVSKSQTGKTWAEVLNGFHAESYFTGNRRRAGIFITDSERMGVWRIDSSNQSPRRTVRPYGADFFWYSPRPHHPGELEFSFSGQTESSVSAAGGKTWALSALVFEQNGSAAIRPISVNQNGEGKFTLEQWHDKSGVLLIATNGSPERSREITVRLEGVEDITDPKNVPLNIFPNIVSLRRADTVRIAGTGVSDIKIYTIDGKLAGHWNSNARTSSFTKHEDYIAWIPKSASKSRLSPGTYYITASAKHPVTSKKSNKKTKIMVTP